MNEPAADLDRGLRLFLDAATLVCAAMVIFWLTRLARKGPSAYLMATAFAVLGGLLVTFRQEGPTWLLVVLGSALGILLVADFFVRVGRARP